MGDQKYKHLYVEGRGDKDVIVKLMKANFPSWDNNYKNWPVNIEPLDGIDNIIKRNVISGKLKNDEVKTLGIVIDADEQFSSRWERLHEECSRIFPKLPDSLPKEGLIIDNNGIGDHGEKRLGIWIMPDNASRGMMETFLSCLVPGGQDVIWQKAQDSVVEAKILGAPYNDCHIEKSNIYTWLAWQDPPGQSLGRALIQKQLDPNAEAAKPFVDWFCELFEIEITKPKEEGAKA